jgi:tetratricopeptide (TPR) repeat protein
VALADLAEIRIDQGRLRDAKNLNDQAISVAEEQLNDGLRFSATQKDLFQVLIRSASFDTEIAAYGDAEARYERLDSLPWSNARTAHLSFLRLRARAYALAGKRGDAEKALQEARFLAESNVDHNIRAVEAPFVLAGLADLRTADDQLADAHKLYEQALGLVAELDKNSLQANAFDEFALPRDRADIVGGYGRLLAREGRLEDAEAELQRALTLRENFWEGKKPIFVARSIDDLGNLRMLQGRYVDAEVLFRRALGIRESLGSDNPLVARTAERLASAQREAASQTGAAKR